ncbi:MAG: NAD(P)/FAD-dependent oxidoreductase [Acidobacteria bacterium]|nr:NAD(P)/FAD-dependent oxidoreductase [Acidobacteriota bacterium]MBU1339154.1 NAD(P)/FAD-dependent oxidoreductase [Acidobacteriota bacterium]MBU1473930.1 NAD(P)/FAD-dependent oxidoreductase [Acidobacteriota bacterium]MCG2814837.1 NAD(P)/FAD-dependent oxidoreductase [Candidatus Aminicenantes bacterium]
MNKQVAIIGAGPAGTAAAIQLKRSGIDFILLEKNEVGGLLHNANLVENYPGYPEGISGPDLCRKLSAHLEQLSIPVHIENAQRITVEKGRFLLSTSRADLTAKIVILATGTKPKTLEDFDIPPAAKPFIFYEVHPLLNIEDKTIAVVGAGDAAFDYALNLSRRNRVTIIQRGDFVRGLPLLVERSSAQGGIDRACSYTLKGMDVRNNRLSIDFIHRQTNQIKTMELDFLLLALGREPRLELLERMTADEIRQLRKNGRLHLIGDVKNRRFRQTSISTGDGIKAAMKIHGQMGQRQ